MNKNVKPCSKDETNRSCITYQLEYQVQETLSKLNQNWKSSSIDKLFSKMASSLPCWNFINGKKMSRISPYKYEAFTCISKRPTKQVGYSILPTNFVCWGVITKQEPPAVNSVQSEIH